MHEYAEFVQKYPAYDKTHNLDELRERDYGRLERLGQIYLDYTGGGLYAELQLRAHQKVLAENVFGNPHSSNPTSQTATRLIESTRQTILQFFHAESRRVRRHLYPECQWGAQAGGRILSFRARFPLPADFR